MAVSCCLFPSTRKTRCRTRSGSRRSASSNAAAIMSSMRLGDRRGDPLVPGLRPGVRLPAGGRGGDVLRLPDGGGEVRDRDDLGHLLDPGPGAVVLAGVPAVLRAHGDALAVALHHDHVAVRLLFLLGVAGPFLVEVTGPGGEALRDPGQLGVADPHPGPVLDDLLGLPVPADARWKAARARIPIEYGSPGITDRASAGYRFSSCPCRYAIRVTRTGPKTLARPRSCPASTVRCRTPAALVTCGARSSRAASRANVACSSRRSSSRPSRLIASSRSPWSRYRDSSAAQVSRPGELLRGIRQRRRQLPVHRGLAPVLQDLPHRHHQPSRHRAPPLPAVNDFRPSSRKRPRSPRNRQSRTAPGTSPENHQQGR